MGEVFLARDLATGAECALKRLRPKAVSDRSALAREFALLAGIRHPAVVEVLELGFEPDGAAWYAMQYAPGSSADQLGALTRESLAFVAVELAHGLEALHQAGIVHGDLKPSNVVIIPGELRPAAVRIVDFGLARSLGGNDRRHVGTAGFAAPEIVAGGALTPASDLYALGATLYSLATGHSPFEGESSTDRLRRQAEGPAPIAPLERAEVSPAFSSLVLRLLSPNPAERPRDAREVRRELERILPGARRPLAERLRTFVLVGRERELARLDAWLAAAEPSTLLLTGEPGIGRTSLLDAFAARQALAQRPVFRIAEPGAEKTIALAESRAVDGVRPLLIVDDIDRLPPAAIVVLRRLAVDPYGRLRMLWSRSALAAMPEEEQVLALSGRLALLELSPLDRSGIGRLIAARIAATAAPDLVEHLFAAVSGSPGRTIELLRAAATTRAIVEDDGGVRVDSARLATLRPSGDFAAAQLERISGLPESAQHAALALAVCSGRLRREQLAKLLAEADGGIDALFDSGFVRTEQDGAIRFAFGSLAEPLVASADADTVRALHRQALEVLEPTPGGRIHHMAAAGDPRGAIQHAEHMWETSPEQVPVELVARIAEEHAIGADLWFDRAAQAARRRGAYQDAARYLERAIERTQNDALRAERWEKLAVALNRAGGPGEVERAIAKAMSCEPTPAVRARLLGTEAARLYGAGLLSEALAAAQEAIDACAQAGDVEGAGNAALTAGSVLLALDRLDDAEVKGKGAAEEYAACGNAVGEARAIQLQGMIAQRRGRTPEARALYERALERAKTSQSRLAIEEGLNHLGQLEGDLGRGLECREHFRQMLRIALEDGRGHSTALAAVNLANVEGFIGRPREAVRLARRAIRLTRAFLPSLAFAAHSARARGLRAMGLLNRAQRVSGKAVGLALQQASVEGSAWCRAEHGRALFELERYSEVVAIPNPRAESSWTSGEAMLELVVGRAALRLADRRRAAQAVRAAKDWLAQHEHRYVAAVASQLRAELSLAEGRLDEAIESLDSALAGFESYPAPHDRAMALLDAARLAIHSHVDRRAPVAEWLRKSVALFERLGNRTRRAQAIEVECEWLRGQVEHGLVEAERGLIEKVGELLRSLSDYEELSQRAMELAVDQFEAERGVLLVLDEATGTMEPIAQCGAADATSAEEILQFSRRLVQRVVNEARSIRVFDAPQDPQAASRSVEELRLRALLCVPMFLDGRVVGAVYLDSRNPGVFGDAERKLLDAFAMMMAVALEKSRASERLTRENLKLRREMSGLVRAGLIGSSRALRKIIPLIERAAGSQATVLLTGETGTGKGRVAEVIHQSGPRANKPFVPVNCPALEKNLLISELFGILDGVAVGVKASPGHFRAADKGTIFLDEITEIGLDQQGALLAAVEKSEVTPVGSTKPVFIDVRIIAATNRDLKSAVENGRFREDLLHRLDVIRIELPPLRERKGDIPELARHFAAQVAARDGRQVPELASDFLADLMQRDWPGNVRELENFVERAMVMTPGDVLHAPTSMRKPTRRFPTNGGAKLKETQEARERQAIEHALRMFHSNQSKAAGYLGLKESTLRAKMAKYGIQGRRKPRPE